MIRRGRGLTVWGEDGLAGFCDIEQRLCLAQALWNGRDPILKERAFGLTGPQGNHGEDVKEYWWYELTPRGASADEAMVMRQAFAGLLWSKQLFYYDVARWLDGDPGQPQPAASPPY